MSEFYELLRLSEEDNPEAIFEIAQLYNSGEMQSTSDIYVEWFKKFLDNKIVKQILCDLDSSEAYASSVDIYTYYSLLAKIREAGICLGLYYRFSNSIEEIIYANECLYSAWLASKFDYTVIDDGGKKTDVLSLMNELSNKIMEMEE